MSSMATSTQMGLRKGSRHYFRFDGTTSSSFSSISKCENPWLKRIGRNRLVVLISFIILLSSNQSPAYFTNAIALIKYKSLLLEHLHSGFSSNQHVLEQPSDSQKRTSDGVRDSEINPQGINAQAKGAAAHSRHGPLRAPVKLKAPDQEAYNESADVDVIEANRLVAHVVKIIVTQQKPAYTFPWKMTTSKKWGTAFFIWTNHLITASHIVSNALEIEISFSSHVGTVKAGIVAISHDHDIALLKIPEENVWAESKPVVLGSMPSLRQKVLAIGYPDGGKAVTTTSGIVSRIDIGRYSHSHSKHSGLLIQVDAATNKGSSGSPVFSGGALIGMAFQAKESLQLAGYILPIEVITHFLEDYKYHHRFTGTPSFGVRTQTLENNELRKYYGLQDIQNIYSNHHKEIKNVLNDVENLGILVTQVDSKNIRNFLHKKQRRPLDQEKSCVRKQRVSFRPKDSEVGVEGYPTSRRLNEEEISMIDGAQKKEGTAALEEAEAASESIRSEVTYSRNQNLIACCFGFKVDDVILQLMGHNIGSDATVVYRNSRINYHYLLTSKFNGDTATATVLRDKVLRDIQVPLGMSNEIVPNHVWGTHPRYIVFGGFTFVPLTREFYEEIYPERSSNRQYAQLLAYLTADEYQTDELEESVILHTVEPTQSTKRLLIHKNSIVVEVGKQKLKSLRHLSQLLEEASNEGGHQHLLEMTVLDPWSKRMKVVIDVHKAATETEEVLDRHQIPLSLQQCL